jgi:hypothetical protein
MAITLFTSDLPKALAEALVDRPHKVYLYLEYTNASGTVPTGYTSSAAIPNLVDPRLYYSTLATTKNYLRVPAVRDPNVVASGTAPTYAITTTFFGQSNAAGASANPVSAAFGTGSICYGAALVLAPSAEDKSQDLIIGRSYFVGAQEYLTKTASSELFVTFPFTTTVTLT